MKKRTFEVVSRMPAAPGLSAVLFSPCGRYLYQLSAEADSVHTRLTATGELVFASPAGVFPRTMRLMDAGRRMIVSGGAAAEAYILRAPELTGEKVIALKHPCFAADTWNGGLVLVCAAEGEDIQTVVYTLSARGVRPREIIRLPGQPGGLCVCEDGQSVLVSTLDGLLKLDLPTGQILWNRPEWALCARMQECAAGVLVSDTLDGRVGLIDCLEPWKQHILFSGASPQACFL